MRSRLTLRRPRLATACALLMALLLVAGGLIWYRPVLTTPRQNMAEVPAPPALFAATQYALPGHKRACMDNVTVTPQSQVVEFQLFPARSAKGGGPPVAFSVQGPGYQATSFLHGGYPGGIALLPLSPPKHALIATACIRNLGTSPVSLVGTDEARTVSRSHPLTVGARPLPGDVALAFLQSRPKSPLHELGQAAQHASNLTDGLLPPALILAIAVITAFGVPAVTILAVRMALAEQERPAAKPAE